MTEPPVADSYYKGFIDMKEDKGHRLWIWIGLDGAIFSLHQKLK